MISSPGADNNIKGIDGGKYPGHAFIIAGGSGENRREAARRLAREALCRAELKRRPCGLCRACVLAMAGNHPDLIEIEPQGQSVKIQQVREMRRRIALRALEDSRAVVINEAGNLTEEAANALLTVLEEPPPGTVFFLTAPKAEDLLPTIISRCVQIKLGLAEAKIPDWIREDEINGLLSRGDLVELLAFTGGLERQREKAIDFADFVMRFYRGKLEEACKHGGPEAWRPYFRCLDQALLARYRLLNNANVRLALDVLAMNLAVDTGSICRKEREGKEFAESHWNQI
ncbi:MAG: hypothetical protein ACM3WV_03630 [Bacillota bacterium]